MDTKRKPIFSSTREFRSFEEGLADQIIEGENPIVNYGHTYGVRQALTNKGITNFEMVVYHGYPSVSPHFTLSVVREGRGTKLLDVSKEQAEGLRTETITPRDIIEALRKPLPVFVPLNGELVCLNDQED